MSRTKLSIALLIGVFLLTGCQSPGQSRNELEAEVDYLRQELLDIRDQINSDQVEIPLTETNEINVSDTTENLEDPEPVIPKSFDTPVAAQLSYIQINSPQQSSIFYEDPIYVHGTTSNNCSKVVAKFQGSFGQEDIYTLTSYELGDTSFRYGISHGWNNLTPGENNYTINAHCSDGVKQTALQVYYEPSGGGVEMGKPVIYLYPETTQNISVKASPEGGLTIVEPLLTKAGTWEVSATPEGEITNKTDGSNWEYLFWEGIADIQAPDSGFVVESKELEGFFKQKLQILGLNKKETADFLEFWVPEISNKKNDKIVISFVSQSVLDKHAPLTITPAPETLIRVYFDYRPYVKGETVKTQKLEKAPERKGFTTIEWGGTLR